MAAAIGAKSRIATFLERLRRERVHAFRLPGPLAFAQDELLNLSTTTVRATYDPTNSGTGVPQSLAGVISAGATVDEPHYAASLRMRYFGPRQPDSQGDATSPPSMLFNTQFTAKLSNSNSLTFDLFYILNAQVADSQTIRR